MASMMFELSERADSSVGAPTVVDSCKEGGWGWLSMTRLLPCSEGSARSGENIPLKASITLFDWSERAESATGTDVDAPWGLGEVELLRSLNLARADSLAEGLSDAGEVDDT